MYVSAEQLWINNLHFIYTLNLDICFLDLRSHLGAHWNPAVRLQDLSVEVDNDGLQLVHQIWELLSTLSDHHG